MNQYYKVNLDESVEILKSFTICICKIAFSLIFEDVIIIFSGSNRTRWDVFEENLFHFL